MRSVDQFHFDTHVLHIVLSFLTFGSWLGVYWWRYQLARYRYQEAVLTSIAEAQEAR